VCLLLLRLATVRNGGFGRGYFKSGGAAAMGEGSIAEGGAHVEGDDGV
jgi:hypothetical protein